LSERVCCDVNGIHSHWLMNDNLIKLCQFTSQENMTDSSAAVCVSTGDEAAAIWTTSTTVHYVQRWRGSRLRWHCTVGCLQTHITKFAMAPIHQSSAAPKTVLYCCFLSYCHEHMAVA